MCIEAPSAAFGSARELFKTSLNKVKDMKKTTMLLIMDGFGIAPADPANAISHSKTPELDRLFETRPNVLIQASGRYVGLPDGQMGNSEVGHTNMGAGRVVWQELSRIGNEIESGSFFRNEALLKAMAHVNENGSALHVFGLMSDGGVHSHIEHIKALARMAQMNEIEKLFIHCFMDGRDTAPTSGAGYVEEMESCLAELGLGQVGTVMGRYYAMDRDKRWERVKLAYDALTAPCPSGIKGGAEAVKSAYEAGETDEFIKPIAIEGFSGIKSGDSVIFANFRPDRAREITRAFVDPDFDGFERPAPPEDLVYVCMTQYDATIPNAEIAFRPQSLRNTLGEYASALGKTQLRIAETEKYAHVTFFFNGGVEAPYEGESRILVASPKVATYDLQPEMSAYEVTEKAAAAIDSGEFDMIIMNLANCDMVGHTGVFEAAVKAVETVDSCVGTIVRAMEKNGGDLLITADHGNVDEMMDETGAPMTAHTTNPVPLILVSEKDLALDEGGALCDLAPTLLGLMGEPVPAEMEGRSLLKALC